MVEVKTKFTQDINTGIPSALAPARPYPKNSNRAPKRKDILSDEEKMLAIKNALRYFPGDRHAEVGREIKKRVLRLKVK